MLYKNDELYKLAPNDIKVLTEKFKRFPLAIIYPPERVVPSRSKQNKLPDKPNSISFPLVSNVKTKTGTERWRYAENVIVKEHGVKKFTPGNFRFNGRHLLQETDAELAWFLFTKSSYCKGGLNQGKTIKFMFEDLISDAERRADSESIKSRVKAMIFGEDFGLSEEKLRAVAKAYFIKNVDQLTFAQVKLAVDHAVNRDKRDGLKQFVEMTNMDEFLKIRGRIQDLMDKKHLGYDATRKEWQWLDEKGDRIDSICKVAPGRSPNDALYDFYMGNRTFQEVFEAAEKAGKVIIS